MESGDIIIANNGNNSFEEKIDFIEDGLGYFLSGDDQYYFHIKDSIQVDKNKWIIADYF